MKAESGEVMQPAGSQHARDVPACADADSLSAGKGSASRLAGSAGKVGVATLLSRVFGFGRDAAISYVLGAGAISDAFYVAFRIPNLLRRLLAEGNLTMSFVPVFTESLRRSSGEAKEVVDLVFSLLLGLLSLVTLAGVLGAAWFVRLTALGFEHDPEKFALTVSLTRVTFPYIALVSLGALVMGVLNARKRFLLPAAAPIFLNIGMMAGALWLAPYFENPAVAVAWGVILGGVLQLGVQVPSLARLGFLPRLDFRWHHPAVKKMLRLMLPSVYGSAVYQLNVLVITFMASYLPHGSVSYLWNADRVIEFPLGVFAVSLATVVLPTLSDHAAESDFARMKQTFRQALVHVWWLNIPAAVGLIVLAKPIVATLFFRGAFTRESTMFTAQALQCFAVGLPFVSATRITSSAFYAVQEAKKPVRAATLAVLVNIVAGFALLWPLKHRGLALGVSLGSVANFALHLWDYRQAMGPLGLRSLFRSVLKMLLASAVMGAALLVAVEFWDLSFHPFALRLLYLSLLIIGGGLLYGVMAWLLRVEGADAALRVLRRCLHTFRV